MIWWRCVYILGVEWIVYFFCFFCLKIFWWLYLYCFFCIWYKCRFFCINYDNGEDYVCYYIWEFCCKVCYILDDCIFYYIVCYINNGYIFICICDCMVYMFFYIGVCIWCGSNGFGMVRNMVDRILDMVFCKDENILVYDYIWICIVCVYGLFGICYIF